MTDQPDERDDDERVRAAFDALRTEDASSAPPFVRTWANATERLHGGRRAGRSRRWVMASAMLGAGALAAVGLVGLLVVRDLASQPERITWQDPIRDPEPMSFLLELPPVAAATSDAVHEAPR